MDRGLWAIWYEIADAQREEYLAWFHGTHIPEKLARPGYLWAAHYALEAGDGRAYLALFAASSTAIFLNPSPAQLALRQSTQTRRMIGMRQQAQSCILAEESRVDGPCVAQRGPGLTAGPVVQFGCYSTASSAVDDDLGAWYAQERLPLLARLPGCIGARKLLVSVGAQKHAILHEFESMAAREQHFAPHEADAHKPDTWMGRVRPQLSHAPGSPMIGQRLWPAVAMTTSLF
jgi:hypothetical protein